METASRERLWKDSKTVKLCCTFHFLFAWLWSQKHVAFRVAANIHAIDLVCKMRTCCLINLVLTLREPQYLAKTLVSRFDVSQCGNRNDAQLHYFWMTSYFWIVKLEIGWKGFAYYCPKLFQQPLNFNLIQESNGFKISMIMKRY